MTSSRSADVYRSGFLLLDLEDRLLRRIDDGRVVKLWRHGALMMAALMAAGGRMMTQESLRTAVWGEKAPGSESLVRVQMRLVRRALAKIGADHLIAVEWGRGYALNRKEAPVPALLFDDEQWAAYNRILAAHMRINPADVALVRRATKLVDAVPEPPSDHGAMNVQ